VLLTSFSSARFSTTGDRRRRPFRAGSEVASCINRLGTKPPAPTA
jgi:hypothetical protein